VASKLNHVVQRAALRTARALDITVVGIDKAALLATENVILAGCRLESPTTMLKIYCHGGKCRKQNHDVGKDERLDGHGGNQGGALALEWPFVGGNNCQVKVTRPSVGAAASRACASRRAKG
jgi:hypothetical protein